MKTTIEIKTIFGNVIFSHEKEDNTIKDTVEAYIKKELDSGKWRADLTRANLTYANLTRANLTYANLTYANLTYANLTRADLTDANLTRADLTVFKNDIWAVLIRSNEVAYLKKALIEGKVDGSVYEGDCCCLVGTIANSKGCSYKESALMNGLIPDSSRPAERWFLQIGKGMTPETSGVVKLTLEWISEFEELLNARLAIA